MAQFDESVGERECGELALGMLMAGLDTIECWKCIICERSAIEDEMDRPTDDYEETPCCRKKFHTDCYRRIHLDCDKCDRVIDVRKGCLFRSFCCGGTFHWKCRDEDQTDLTFIEKKCPKCGTLRFGHDEHPRKLLDD